MYKYTLLSLYEHKIISWVIGVLDTRQDLLQMKATSSRFGRISFVLDISLKNLCNSKSLNKHEHCRTGN